MSEKFCLVFFVSYYDTKFRNKSEMVCGRLAVLADLANKKPQLPAAADEGSSYLDPSVVVAIRLLAVLFAICILRSR